MAFGQLSPKQPRAFQPNISLSSQWTGQAVLRRPGGRLTLTSGTPVTTSDVTGASAATVYYTPYINNLVPLYDGVQWRDVVFTEKSISLPATTATMYDVWGYYDAPNNALALELLSWSSGTARATNLGTQDGTYVKSTDSTRLYLGSVYTGASSGQSEDSVLKRYLWNMYNRVARPLVAVDGTNTWSYSTATIRQANNNTANKVDVIIGLQEDLIHIEVYGKCLHSTTTAKASNVYVGLDSTTAGTNDLVYQDGCTSSQNARPQAVYNRTCAIGKHYFAWLEKASGTATHTWYGDNGSTDQQCGLFGWIMA